MTSPLAAFLEGIGSGFQSGHEFHEGVRERRRRRTLEEEERARRNFERGRGDAERAQETGIEYVPSRGPDLVAQFDEGVRGRADRLRRGVGDALVPRSDMRFDHFGDEVALPQIRGMEDRIQFGGFQKVRPSAAEQVAHTEEHQAELAAAVGNQLAKSRPGLGINPGTQEATLLGMGKLPLEPETWAPRTRQDQLDWLRDTGVISQRTRAGRAAASADQRQDLGTVERQVDDTRSDLARAERDMPTRGDLTDYDPAARARFATDSTRGAGRVAALQHRADSLGRVRDSIAGETQGRAPARAVTRTPAEWVAEVWREHPAWTPEQVAAEARRRAGAR